MNDYGDPKIPAASGGLLALSLTHQILLALLVAILVGLAAYGIRRYWRRNKTIDK